MSEEEEELEPAETEEAAVVEEGFIEYLSGALKTTLKQGAEIPKAANQRYAYQVYLNNRKNPEFDSGFPVLKRAGQYWEFTLRFGDDAIGPFPNKPAAMTALNKAVFTWEESN